MKKLIVLAGCAALLTLAFACQPAAPPDARAADEAALKDLDAQWSKAAGAKDVDKTVSYYADDALVLPTNAPAANTRDAIKKIWQGFLTSPGFKGGWTASRVEVARSGEIGYVSGTYDFTLNDASGKPVTDHGKFLEIWKKQTDGTWKAAVDIWNSDLPVPAPSSSPEKK